MAPRKKNDYTLLSNRIDYFRPPHPDQPRLMNDKEWAKIIDRITAHTLGDLVKGRNINPTYDTLMKILQHVIDLGYSEEDGNWMITGKGTFPDSKPRTKIPGGPGADKAPRK